MRKNFNTDVNILYSDNYLYFDFKIILKLIRLGILEEMFL